MATIRYLVPYEVAIKAHDSGSGKPLVNLFYFKTGVQGGAPPAYGAPIAGGGSTTTLLGNILSWWTPVRAVLNMNYVQDSLVMRAIIGKRFSTPLFPIVALVTGMPVLVQTGLPHGLSTGNTVQITGVTMPGTVNGNWVITVLSTTTFTLNNSNIAGPWSGDGMVQRVQGALQLLYADTETLINTGTGGIAFDALPLFATASTRRLNPGIGRHFRSRVSFSPGSEIDVNAGQWLPAFTAALDTNLGPPLGGYINGGTVSASDRSFHIVFSRELALGLTSPFIQSDTYTAFVADFATQPNCGSLTRRKPKLTQGITP
jgi:hypothetical protein